MKKRNVYLLASALMISFSMDAHSTRMQSEYSLKDEIEIKKDDLKKIGNIFTIKERESEECSSSDLQNSKKESVKSVEELKQEVKSSKSGKSLVVDPSIFRSEYAIRFPLQVAVTLAGTASTILGTVPFVMGDTEADESKKFALRVASITTGWISVGGSLLIRWLDRSKKETVDELLQNKNICVTYTHP